MATFPSAQVGFGTLGNRGYSRPQQSNAVAGTTFQTGFLEVRFVGRSGDVIGVVRTDVQKNIIKELTFVDDDKGSSTFNLTLNSLPEFSIDAYSQIRIRLYASTFDWYSGIILQAPEFGIKRLDGYKFSGKGFRYYLEGENGLKADVDYTTGTDIAAVFADIVQNYVAPFSPIKYSAPKIDNPSGVVLANDIELGKFPIAEVFDTLADMAGYYWQVDGDREAVFKQDPTVNQRTFFVGYGINDFQPKLNNEEIKNTVLVQRQSGRGSGGAGWALAGNYSDATSIALYGKRELIFQVPGFFDDDDADIIGAAVLAANKDPKFSASFSGFKIQSDDDFLEPGSYRFILPYDEDREIWLALDDATDWTALTGSSSTVSKDTSIFIYADGSVRFDIDGSTGDEWETMETFEAALIQSVSFYVRSDATGSFFNVGIGVDDWKENIFPVAVPVSNEFFRVSLDVRALNLSKISYFGIEFTSDVAASVYLDKVEVLAKGYKTYTMERKRTTYQLKPGTGLEAKGEFGQVPFLMEDYIQSILKTNAELRFVSEIR